MFFTLMDIHIDKNYVCIILNVHVIVGMVGWIPQLISLIDLTFFVLIEAKIYHVEWEAKVLSISHAIYDCSC